VRKRVGSPLDKYLSLQEKSTSSVVKSSIV
jgi:hypothetical protein